MSRAEDRRAAALEAALSEDERALLDELAVRIARRRMVSPAIFCLESLKPLAVVSSQALQFFRPIVQAIWTNPVTYDRVARLLERRGAVELLLQRLEAVA
jgi:hypothetical protein